MTNNMQIVIALHHDAQRLDSERVKDPSDSFCNVASKLIRHKIKVIAIDAQCAIENIHTHKCYDDCAKLSVQQKRNDLKSPIGKSGHSQLPMEHENQPFASIETAESAFMEHEPFTLSLHIKERIADIIIIINERKSSARKIPFTKELEILPIAVDLINYHSHHDGSGCASLQHNPQLGSIANRVGSSLKGIHFFMNDFQPKTAYRPSVYQSQFLIKLNHALTDQVEILI